jgi:hypothetical protein
MTKSARVAFPMLVILFTAVTAFAQPPKGGPGDDHHGPGPRPEMFVACKDKKAGDSCDVAFGERKATGKCAAVPDGKLICHVAPPPEMLKACEGKKEGDACTAEMPNRKVDGNCRKGRMDDKLICRPDRHEGGGPGGK